MPVRGSGRRLDGLIARQRIQDLQQEEREEAARINRLYWKRFRWSMSVYYRRDETSGMVLACMGYERYGRLYGGE